MSEPTASRASARVPERRVVRTIRRLLTGFMVVAVVFSIGFWLATRDPLPSTIRIAAGAKGGLYYRVGNVLKGHFDRLRGHSGIALETDGTADNLERLRKQQADLAIIQTGGRLPPDVVGLAPLYPDVVIVVARKEVPIRSLADFRGRRVAVGLPGSGMRRSATEILSLYGIPPDGPELQSRYFTALLTDPGLTGAVITTGLLNEDLQQLLRTGQFKIVSLDEAQALTLRHPYLSQYTIPRGIFSANPAIPEAPVETVTATAVLAARKDAGSELVTASLRALYEEGGQVEIPLLIPRAEARNWTQVPLHPAAQTFFDPLQGFDTVSNLVQSLDAGKELIVALTAGLYLIWERWRRLRERAHEQEIQAAKDRLDEFLNETVRIERAQMGVWDRERLIPFLEEVTRIKLRALESLTQEELRGGTQFLIFITQCASLIQKMQFKLTIGAASRGEEAELARLAEEFLSHDESLTAERFLAQQRSD